MLLGRKERAMITPTDRMADMRMEDFESEEDEVSRSDKWDVRIDRIRTIIPFESITCGIIIEWSGNIGWGEYEIYQTEDGRWHGDSECMDRGEDKEFLKYLLKYLVDNTEVR